MINHRTPKKTLSEGWLLLLSLNTLFAHRLTENQRFHLSVAMESLSCDSVATFIPLNQEAPQNFYRFQSKFLPVFQLALCQYILSETPYFMKSFFNEL